MAMVKEKMYGLGLSRSKAAEDRRTQQLKEWERSDTSRQPGYIVSSRAKPRVKFADNVIFMAAVQSGDIEEVERLVAEAESVVNSVNEDGLTALHQVSGVGGGWWRCRVMCVWFRVRGRACVYVSG